MVSTYTNPNYSESRLTMGFLLLRILLGLQKDIEGVARVISIFYWDILDNYA